MLYHSALVSQLGHLLFPFGREDLGLLTSQLLLPLLLLLRPSAPAPAPPPAPPSNATYVIGEEHSL